MRKLLVIAMLLVSGSVLAQAPEMPDPSVLQTAEDYGTYHDEVVKGMEYIVEASPREMPQSGVPPFVLAWLTGSPTVTVTVNMEMLPGVTADDYIFSAELLMKYLSGMALAHINGESDEVALQLAGLEAVLNGYENVSDQKKVKEMEKLLKLKKKGKLRNHVEKIVG